MVFFVMGNYSFERVVKLGERLLGSIEPVRRGYIREELAAYTPQTKEIKKHTRQVHLVMGGRSYSYTDKRRFAFVLLNHILGGDFMSSILNMHLREKEGLVYEVCSNYTTYADTGNWNIYLGCDYDKVEHVTEIVYSELNKLIEASIAPKELRLAKVRLLSYLTIGGENKESWILGVAKQYLNTGRVMEKQEVESLVNAVTADDVRRCAAEILNREKLTVLKFV